MFSIVNAGAMIGSRLLVVLVPLMLVALIFAGCGSGTSVSAEPTFAAAPDVPAATEIPANSISANEIPAAGSDEVALTATPEPPPQQVSVKASELLADATVYTWEDWELDFNITAQTLRVFPTEQATDDYYDVRSGDLVSSGWINMGREEAEIGDAIIFLFRHPESGFLGLGYNLTSMVEIQGKTYIDTLNTTLFMTDALCCG